MAALGETAPNFLINASILLIFFLGGRRFVLHLSEHVASSQSKDVQTGRTAHFTTSVLIISSISAFRKASCGFVPQGSCSAHPSLGKGRTFVVNTASVTREGKGGLSRVPLGASTALTVVVAASKNKSGHVSVLPTR